MCQCGGSPGSRDKVIALEKLLYEIPTEPPSTLASCCNTCLNSMIHDVQSELGSRRGQLFELVDPTSTEGIEIAKHFNRSICNKIIRIERINNPKLLQEFEKASSGLKPAYFFHGSNNSNYVSIANNGFDIGRSRDGLLGVGIYFAVDAQLSSQFTTGVREHRGECIYNMLYCKVAVAPEDGYECDMRCIRNDRRAYPEYIIYYI